MNPLVSIIVPCYNQAQYLPETLDSVLAQTYPNWECVIVNDGSPDNTAEIANLYCIKDERFKYLNKENGGLSSARNAGIRNSKGEFILPLDSDDLIEIKYLEKAIERFIHHPETKLVYCKAKLFGSESGEWKLPDYDFIHLLYENIIFCSAVFKKQDYLQTNGYNEELKFGLEDWDFWLNLLNENDLVYKIPEFCFQYRIRNNSMIRSLNEESRFFIRNEIFRRHKIKYEKYLPELIWRSPELSSQMIHILSLEQEIRRIQNSKAYRLGKFVLKLFSFFRHKILKR